MNGDFLGCKEGSLLAADGIIVHCNDFAVNEAMLTGESLAVSKNTNKEDNNVVFQGTLAVSGLAVYEVTATGAESRAAQLAALAKNMRQNRPYINRF